MSADGQVALVPFEPAHAALLAEWLARLHVARWHPDRDERVEWALHPPAGAAHALIALEARPIGYLRSAPVGRDVLDALGLFDIPAGAVDIDILIGDAECVGRGLGPRALALLIERLRRDPAVPLAGLSPSIDNLAAQRAYTKAGFRKVCEYDAPGFGRLALMTRPLSRI